MEWGKEVVVRGARVHNLKNVDVDVPLHSLVGVTGVSGSGKSSLALGVLYAEGSRRYLEALSAYTRRRLSQAARADVDIVEGVPAAIALHQRPAVPGVRSTFGTATELLNSLRLLFSRLGAHRCPNGHSVPPSLSIASTGHTTCPTCGVRFAAPGAEAFSFNEEGACETCEGTGETRQVDRRALVPDESLSIDQGAVAAWGSFGASLLPQVVAALGVRTDIPFRDLTDDERHMVLDGEETTRPVVVTSKNGNVFELNAKYRNAVQVIDDALRKAQSEKGLARLDRFVHVARCPACGGSRLNAQARSTTVAGESLDVVSAWSLEQVTEFVRGLPSTAPAELREMAERIVEAFTSMGDRLLGLGLGYVSLDRSSRTLSTGELQRVQLGRALRSSATGILYVLDEPSIGLHPANIESLLRVVRRLVETGNSVVLVDHDVDVLRHADWLIEVGPDAGTHGGQIVATGDVAAMEGNPSSRIGGFLSGREPAVVRTLTDAEQMFAEGRISLRTTPHFTLHGLSVDFPLRRLTAVTGVSGSGKTTLVLESLAAALEAQHTGMSRPAHVAHLDPGGIERTVVVDAAPIGRNVRSTVATYTGVLDDLRRAYAHTDAAKALGLTASSFSYNTGELRCPSCEGVGQVFLDVQFLPDVDIACPTCGGTRYSPRADEVSLEGVTLPQALALTVEDARSRFARIRKVEARLRTLEEIGLGYLTLGEATPALSGGEAQRLKLVADLERELHGTLFIFDEPSVGLHPADVRVLLAVLQRLLDAGATVIVIEHDLDVIANADHVIDLGPGGGADGGQIVAATTPEGLTRIPESLTGRYLRLHTDSRA
ncbi:MULTISPECIES: excinuclease ABC subunit A [unclassified Microbacterium]|uniref:excinuclease ABC subunit A n=1 Tax=unclassified Microbacterium TaxID=2609290 RepID=UPI000CFB7294|nr:MULTISPECIES: excinuclease ABC subunit A [unclassified Microbacterium]PQZ60299.1 excinuclease ABC subunit A [Microbacterium sp. MYb43]PQZ76922.1 excinuclease ABC subunit A [Microbacterium sp. MYb40]PRB23315.1 excinuclease ABC subunit A [Microbacterium sp. MYb54]PRB28237.1 excinuclease ABC subunit A [Microbacterium sp. MYb50]PRB66288.1 excinuclease ABC subunit A [Microbacterium sp. MYb24]